MLSQLHLHYLAYVNLQEIKGVIQSKNIEFNKYIFWVYSLQTEIHCSDLTWADAVICIFGTTLSRQQYIHLPGSQWFEPYTLDRQIVKVDHNNSKPFDLNIALWNQLSVNRMLLARSGWSAGWWLWSVRSGTLYSCKDTANRCSCWLAMI